MSDQSGARGMRESDGAAWMIGAGAAEGRAKTEQIGQGRRIAFDIGGDMTAEPPKQHDRPYNAVSSHHVIFMYSLW